MVPFVGDSEQAATSVALSVVREVIWPDMALGQLDAVGWRQHRAMLLFEKGVRVDPRLAKDRTKRAFRHVTGMVGKGGIAVCGWVDPDLVRAGGLAAELKAHTLQSSHDLSVAKAGQPAHQVLTISG